jgi:hypothetical protein
MTFGFSPDHSEILQNGHSHAHSEYGAVDGAAGVERWLEKEMRVA